MLRRVLATFGLLILAVASIADEGARKLSTSTYHVLACMKDSTDHVTPKTGLTVTAVCSKNAAAFGSCSGAVTEIANGCYKLAGNTTDSNTLGVLLVHFTATGADPLDVALPIVTNDPFINLDTSSTLATVTTCTTATTATTCTNVTNRVTANVDQIDGAAWSTHASGMAPADLRDVSGSAVSASTAQLGVNVVNIAGTASAGTAGYAALDWGHITAPTTTQNLSGTTMATVSGAVGSVTGNVGGNVVGSVGSVATGGITAASIAADAIGASELATDAVTEIQSGLATSTAVAAVQSDTDDIQSRLPAALTGAGNIKADAQVVSDKTGYALTSAYDPAKTAAQAGDAMKLSTGIGGGQILLSSGQVTVGTNNDKSGYSADATSIGGTVQSGGVDVAADAAAILARTDVATSSRMATFSLPTNFSSLSINGSGQVTLAGCSFCITATQVENAVLDAALASHVGAGTVGKKIGDIPISGTAPTSAENAAAVVDQALSGHTSSGTAGQALGLIAGIKAHTDGIGTGQVTVTSPYNATTQKLTLTRGDDYPIGSRGAIPPFTSSSWPDLTDATEVRLTIRRRPPVGRDPILLTMKDTVASRVVGSGEQSIFFEPMSETNKDEDIQTGSTDDLVPGPGAAKWDVQATLADGTVKTLVGGLIDVLEDQTRVTP